MQTALSPCKRLRSSTSKQRLNSLPPLHLPIPFTSLRTQGFPFTVRLKIHTSRSQRGRSTMDTPRAPFLSTLQQRLSLDSPWGFVIYRTTAYAPTETAIWEAFHQKLNLLIQENFDKAAGPEEETSAAREAWTVRWEEDSSMAHWTYDDVKKYISIPSSPRSLIDDSQALSWSL